jgi:hypothetical protein
VFGLTGGVAALAAGGSHTCALLVGSGVKCWGYDAYGQLGIGTTTPRLTPAEVVETPPLTANYSGGRSGSVFTLTGWGFPPNAQLTPMVNGNVLTTTLATNEAGDFIFFLTTAGAGTGTYRVSVTVNPPAAASSNARQPGANTSAAAVFFIDGGFPLRGPEGGGPVFALPPGIAGPYYPIFLPLSFK